MYGIDHLIPTNVGVLEVHDRDRRFAFYAGANVTEGFTDAEAQTKAQTNIFGSGFEDGERVTIGASRKGRVWSYRAAETLKHWVDWCGTPPVRWTGVDWVDQTVVDLLS